MHLRYALRQLRRSPITTAVAIGSLALGTGANTAIFSLVNALILRPLPVDRPHQLVSLQTTGSNSVNGKDLLSILMFRGLERGQRVFSSLTLWDGGGVENFEVKGVLYQGSIELVGPDYFTTLGIRPFLGRAIQPSDVSLEHQSAQIAVLGYTAWRVRFHADPQVIGQSIRINGHPLTIVGVAPESFHGLLIDIDEEVYVPIGFAAGAGPRDTTGAFYSFVGRLLPGVTLDQARVQLETVWPSVRGAALPSKFQGSQRTEFLTRRLVVESSQTGQSWLRFRMTRPLFLLMGLVALVLLVACVNLANLVLARTESRRHEIGVRLALGAGPWSLVGELLTESLILSATGAVFGLLFAVWAARFLIRTVMTNYIGSTAIDTRPDWRVLLFTISVALLTGLLSSAAPTWALQQSDPARTLAASTRSVHGGASLFARLLISVQVAFSLVLVIGAALFVRSLTHLYTSDPGYRRDGVLLVQLFPKPGIRDLPNRTVYFRELTERFEQIPGVERASYSHMGPAAMYEFKSSVSTLAGLSSIPAVFELAGPGLFDVLGMRVLAGRQFTWSDDLTSKKIVIVSRSLAQRLFPSGHAVGQRVRIGDDPRHRDLEIIGVVNNASLWLAQSHEPLAYYLPLLQEPEFNQLLADLRVKGDPAAFAAPVRQTLESVGKQYPLSIRPLTERFSSLLVNERLVAFLSAFFGGLALLLAAIGLYGLMTYSVLTRTSEIGIRMAIGAQRGTVVCMILKQVIAMTGIGIVFGLVAAIVASRFAAGVIFGVSATDPATLGAAVLVLLAAALVAGYLPARRASAVDPMKALRLER